MENIISPIPVDVLKRELTRSKKLTDTNRGHNELYIVTWKDSPNVTTEIGRLREYTFRSAGGSTGNAVDLDEYAKMEQPYKQLIIWDPDAEAIIGGFRFLLGSEVCYDEDGQPIMASAHQFHFSQKYIDEYLPHVVELGRLSLDGYVADVRAPAECDEVYARLAQGGAFPVVQFGWGN